jgi:hypothetical protein
LSGRKRAKNRGKGKPFQEIFEATILGVLKKDPDLRKTLAFKSAGYADILEMATPEYQRMMKLEETVLNKALDLIEHNPEIQDRLVRKTIANIFNVNSVYPTVNNRPVIVRVMEVLREKIRNGQIQLPVTRESLLKIINEVGLGKKSDIFDSPKLVNRRKDIQAKGIPEPTIYSDKDVLLTVGDSVISSMEFVVQLKKEVLSGVAEAQHLWNFLLTAKYRQVIELLSSCRVPRQDKEYVRVIVSAEGKDWINVVLELVRQAVE